MKYKFWNKYGLSMKFRDNGISINSDPDYPNQVLFGIIIDHHPIRPTNKDRNLTPTEMVSAIKNIIENGQPHERYMKRWKG